MIRGIIKYNIKLFLHKSDIDIVTLVGLIKHATKLFLTNLLKSRSFVITIIHFQVIEVLTSTLSYSKCIIVDCFALNFWNSLIYIV